MRRALLAILVVAGLADGPATPTADAATAIGQGDQPAIVVDREGTAHAVWTEHAAGNRDLLHYCRIPRGQSACAGGRVFDPDADLNPGLPTDDTTGPQVMISPFGEVFVLTSRCCGDYTPPLPGGQSRANIVYRSDDDGLTFGPAEVIGTTEPGFPGGSTPAIYDGADRRIVTIATRTGEAVVQGQPLGQATTTRAQLFAANAYNPSIVQRGRGAFTAAWEDLAGTTYVRSYDCAAADRICPLGDLNDATKWGPTVVLPGAELSRLTSGPIGTFLLYRSTDPATPRQWFMRSVNGTALGPPAAVSGPDSSSPHRDVTQDNLGRLLVATVDSGSVLNHRSSFDGVTWSAPLAFTAVNDFTIQNPRIAAATGDAGFTGFVAWTSQPGGVENPAVLLGALPEPVPPPPPPPPAAGPPPAGGPAPPKPPAACQIVQFGPIDVLAEKCMTRSGNRVTATSALLLDGLRIVPAAGARIVFDTRERTIETTGSISIYAGDALLFRGRIDWKIPAGNTVTLPELDVGKFGGKLLGFPLSGKAGLRFRRGAAELPIHLELPKLFGGVSGDVTLRADNLSGVRLRDLHVKVGTAFLGPLELRKLAFDYDADARSWAGEATVVLPPRPPGPELSAGIGFRAGALDFLKGELVFPGSGIPLDPLSAVYLNRIRFSLKTDPLTLSGGVGLTAGPAVGGTGAVRVDGDLTLTLPNPPKPTVLRADGTVLVVDIPLGSAYAELRTNGYLGFGGKLEYTFSGFGARATLDGWLFGRAFNVEAAANICLGDLGCGGGRVVLSSVGFAGCAQTPIADFGAGYKWGDGFPDLMFTGCDVGPYRAIAAQAGVRTVRLASGLPSAFIGVRGAGGAAPHVALVGPGGVRIEPPPNGPLRGASAIAFHTPDGTTWFALKRPAAGDWRVEALPDSVPVTQVVHADGLPKPSVRATVGGRGSRRVVSYRIQRVPGQRVRFVERGSAAARELGVAHGTKGRIRFRPTDGPGGTRRIIAVVESYGTPRAELTVARYVASAPRRPARPRVRARRRGTRVVATWSRVAGATRYLARVRVNDGRTMLQTRGRTQRSVTVTGVGRRDRVTVSVAGLRADGLRGRSRSATVREVRAKRRKSAKPKAKRRAR